MFNSIIALSDLPFAVEMQAIHDEEEDIRSFHVRNTTVTYY